MTKYRQRLVDEIDRLERSLKGEKDPIVYNAVSAAKSLMFQSLAQYDQSGIEELVEVAKKIKSSPVPTLYEEKVQFLEYISQELEIALTKLGVGE